MEGLLQVSSNIYMSLLQCCFSVVLVESSFPRKELQVFPTEGSKLCVFVQGYHLTLEMGPSNTAQLFVHSHCNISVVFVLLCGSLITVSVVSAL